MNKKFILLMLCGALISCGSSSIAPANPYNDDMFDDQPMTVKVSVDPSGLNCSVLAPCNVKISLTPSGGNPATEVTTITTQSVPAILQLTLSPDNYMLNVSGLAANYHPIYPDGNLLANQPGLTGIAVSFESAIEYQQ
jgi:hypothetical protein